MSQENVKVPNDVVRRLFWAFENNSDAFRESLHPEIEWFPIEEDRTPLYGIEAAVRNRNQWLETWDEHRFDLEQVIEQGENVVVSVHITARGKASGSKSTFASTPTSSCGTTRSFTSSTTRLARRPSKPLGCRSSPADTPPRRSG
jgi:ketosteroid isomerase-like protein